MLKTRNSTENKIKPPYKLIVLLVLSALLFVVFCGLAIFSIIKNVTISQANFVMEQATLVRYEKMKDNATLTDEASYQLIYKFVSSDNIVYEGVWKDFIADENYAKSRVGKKVAIYVEHNLQEHSLSEVTYKNHLIFFGVPAIGMLILFIDMIIKVMLYYKYYVCGINKNEVKEPKRMIIPHCVFISVFGMLFVLFASNLGVTLDSYKSVANANFNQEKVEITFYTRDVHTHTRKRGGAQTSETNQTYSTYFEYEIDGNLYLFNYESQIQDENTAKNEIGSEITIYVDKDQGLIEYDLDSSKHLSSFWICLVATIVLGAITCNSLVRIILYFIELRKMTSQIERLANDKNVATIN